MELNEVFESTNINSAPGRCKALFWESENPKLCSCLHFPSGLHHRMEAGGLLHMKGITRQRGHWGKCKQGALGASGGAWILGLWWRLGPERGTRDNLIGWGTFEQKPSKWTRFWQAQKRDQRALWEENLCEEGNEGEKVHGTLQWSARAPVRTAWGGSSRRLAGGWEPDCERPWIAHERVSNYCEIIGIYTSTSKWGAGSIRLMS